MKQVSSTHGQRRLAASLLGLAFIALQGCSGGANEGTASGETADSKIREIAESSKNSRELRKAVLSELRDREQAASGPKGRTPRKSP